MFFQFIIYALGDNAPAELRSGATQIDRGVSSGVQDVSAADKPENYPISQQIPKIEGRIQVG